MADADESGRGWTSLVDDSDADLGFAKLDVTRAARRGYPEAVYCRGKLVAHLRQIAAHHRNLGMPAIFTKGDRVHLSAVREELPQAEIDEAAGLAAWSPVVPTVSGGTIGIVTAGTSDYIVAREAELTARHLGRQCEMVFDVGVAGLSRLLRRLDWLRTFDCLIVVAGMDGALPSVVAGLVSAPVVAVPTSVGYGAAFHGIAPLLTMLNSCSPGVAVVNIDNGFGAACFAAQVTA